MRYSWLGWLFKFKAKHNSLHVISEVPFENQDWFVQYTYLSDQQTIEPWNHIIVNYVLIQICKL